VRLRALGFGLAAALALGGAARAADFDDFKTFCVAPHGDGKAALAAADAVGWSALPDAMMAQLKRPGMEAAQGRMKTDAGAMRFLLVASQAQVGGPTAPHMDACVLGVAPPTAGLVDQVKAWVAAPEIAFNTPSSNLHAYAFIDEGGHHNPIQTQGVDPAIVMKNPKATMVMIQELPQVTMVVYGVPSTTSAP